MLVCAPTGAGKTVVGEFAVYLARAAGQKCFYTTPIKALSNQKYADLVDRYGAGRDRAADRRQRGQRRRADRRHDDRGAAQHALRRQPGARPASATSSWTRCTTSATGSAARSGKRRSSTCPNRSQLVSLSATVSNAEEFGDWLVSVRGDTQGHRPRAAAGAAVAAPAGRHAAVRPVRRQRAGSDAGRRAAQALHLRADAALTTPARTATAARRSARDRSIGRGWRPPDRPEIITRLERAGLLPAITFIFSRAGCDAAVRQCLNAGLWLTSAEERDEISAIVEARTAALPPEDLEVLGYWDWLDGLRRGVATHHAGMVPPFKETVEALFVRGLVKAVFATETLALGINMPARTVVLERLSKYNGETHADLTPGEYTQLTGRAGRRGIDVEGHAVVVWSPDIDPARLAGLASTRTYPLRSSFRPSYNMAVNLVAPAGPGAGAAAARVVVRAVPGRPLGGRPGPPDPGHGQLAGRVQRADAVRPGRLRRSTPRCGASCSDREAALTRANARSRHGAVVAAHRAARPPAMSCGCREGGGPGSPSSSIRG